MDDNDGRFPDDSPVVVRYPRNKREERGAWRQGLYAARSRCGALACS